MVLTQYTYIKEVDPSRLDQEIRNSTVITVALDRVEVLQSGDVDVWFKDALSAGQKTELDNIITAHVKLPLVDAPPTVAVLEQDVEPNKRVGGRFQTRSLLLDIPEGDPNDVSVHDFSFPIPVSILAAQALIDSQHVGDYLDFIVAPDTIIGVLTEDTTASDNVIRVSQTVIDNVFIGAYLKLFNGSVANELGRVIDIGYDDGYGSGVESDLIHVETATTDAFLAASPTYVMMSVKMVEVLEMTSVGRIVIGESKIGSSYVPAGTLLRLNYTNKSGAAKKLGVVLEYLY